MVKLIATKAQTYDRRTIEAGEEFEADEQYAATLVSLGRASRKDDGGKTKASPTTTKSKEEPKTEAGSTYKTRQVKAKGDR